MKFKVGDKVKLIRMDDESLFYKKYLGQIFTVKKVYSNFVTLVENTEENIGPYLKNLELVKDYTYEDLKKSPIGTKITFENGAVLVKDEENYFENVSRCRDIDNLYNLKDNYSDLGKIIKIEEPEYKTVYETKGEILDEAEKRYLRGVIRPFRSKVLKIVKKYDTFTDLEYIRIIIKDDTSLEFPSFSKNTMYKGMKKDKKYTLEELGL